MRRCARCARLAHGLYHRGCYRRCRIRAARVAKISGIGAVKKPRTISRQFARFNSVHGEGCRRCERPPTSTKPRPDYLGVSGRRDYASIGLASSRIDPGGVQHDLIVENQASTALTKGKFSATADRGLQNPKVL